MTVYLEFLIDTFADFGTFKKVKKGVENSRDIDRPMLLEVTQSIKRCESCSNNRGIHGDSMVLPSVISSRAYVVFYVFYWFAGP